jgi:hypothetical protein
MPHSPAKKPLKWSGIGVLAMLAGVIVLGTAVNRLSLLQSLVALDAGPSCCSSPGWVSGRSGEPRRRDR